jgi:uncharacterized membrane protein
LLALILLPIFIIILIVGKTFLKDKKYIKKLLFITFICANVFTVFWYALQYYLLYYEFGVAAPDVSITIIPSLFLLLFWPFILNILFNVLYIILNLPKN